MKPSLNLGRFLFPTDLDDQTFARGFDFQFALGFFHQRAGVGHKGIQPAVVVVGVVVEEDEFFHAGLEGERHGVIHAAVAPAGVGLVFGAVVLGIQNQNIGALDEINHVAVIAARTRFGVGKETDDAIGRRQSVADGEAGMVGAVRADERGADGEIKIAQFFDLDVAGQFRERHGEIGAFHLAGEGGFQTFARAFAAENAQAAAGFVNRGKERQALDVIPVGVGNEEREVERLGLEFAKQRDAELAQAGAGVEDDDVFAAADFNAGGVAAITDGSPPRRGNRAANAPKLDARRGFDGETLAQVGEKMKLKNDGTRKNGEKSCIWASLI